MGCPVVSDVYFLGARLGVTGFDWSEFDGRVFVLASVASTPVHGLSGSRQNARAVRVAGRMLGRAGDLSWLEVVPPTVRLQAGPWMVS